MIIITSITHNNIVSPSRLLTEEEKLTVTGEKFDGTNYIFYQGDKPAENIVYLNPPNWIQFKKNVWANQGLYFSITARANANIFATILKVITDGENSNGDEQDLGSLLNAKDAQGNYLIGFTWTAQEKTTINQYLSENNFTIRIE